MAGFQQVLSCHFLVLIGGQDVVTTEGIAFILNLLFRCESEFPAYKVSGRICLAGAFESLADD